MNRIECSSRKARVSLTGGASLRSSEGQIDFGAANLLPKRSPDIFHPLARHLVAPKICGALDGNSQITNGNAQGPRRQDERRVLVRG